MIPIRGLRPPVLPRLLAQEERSRFHWTKAREREIVRLWKAGLEFTEIAEALGGTSKGAVAGVCDRLGLRRKFK